MDGALEGAYRDLTHRSLDEERIRTAGRRNSTDHPPGRRSKFDPTADSRDDFGLPGGFEQLRDQRDSGRALRPAASDQENAADGTRAGESAARVCAVARADG